jgi:autotransporter translocation and assembly factor TamB
MPKELLAGLVAGKLAENLKETSGIDRLEVEVDAADTPDDADEVKVTVGKELSRRLSVLYGVETRAGEAVQQVTAEYKILERLVVSAFQDTAGEFGGEMQFRLEFR